MSKSTEQVVVARELGLAGVGVMPHDHVDALGGAFPGLYAVRHPQDKMLILVIATSGADAIQLCIEDGFAWAAKQCQVTRIHKRMAEERGVVETFQTAGGAGNAKGKTRLFLAGTQIDGVNQI